MSLSVLVDSGKGGNLGGSFDGWERGGGREKGEMEVLPVHGRGGEHGTFDSATEPFGFAVDVGEGGDGFAGARMRKYEIDLAAMSDGQLRRNDIVLFRYADALLMQCEAMLRPTP